MAMTMDDVQTSGHGWHRVRARIRYGWPPNWPLVVGFVTLLFFAHVALGSNSQGMPLTTTSLFLGLGALSLLTVTGWSRFYYSSTLAVCGGLFTITILVGLIQQTSLFPSLHHPDWDNVPGPGSITIDRDATARETLKLFGLMAAFLIGLNTGRSNRRAQLFYAIFLALAAFYCFVTFLDFSFDPEHIFGVARYVHLDRLSGTYVSANTAATLFGVIVVFACARVVQAWKEASANHDTIPGRAEATLRRGVLGFFALFLALLCLMLTASRGGFAVALLALGVFLVWEWMAQDRKKRRLRNLLGVAAVLGGLVVTALAFGGGMLAERLSDASTAADSRLVMVTTHWNAFLGAPLLGNGLGSFDRVNDLYQTIGNWEVLHRQNAAHNTYLQWLEEAGIVGAIAMFATILVIHWLIYSGLRRRARMRTWLRAQMAVSVLIAAHASVEYSLEVPAFALQWAALMGVAVGLATSSSQRDAVGGRGVIRKVVSVADEDAEEERARSPDDTPSARPAS